MGMIAGMNVIYVLAYWVLWPVFRIFKPTKTIGRQNIQKGGLYCANHTRMSDPLFVAYAMGWPHQIHVMAKEEIMHWPILGWILKHGGIFGVKRGESDVGAIKTAMKYLKSEEKLLIFPEGTRHQDGEFGAAKTGAAMLAIRTGVPILPVYITPERKLFQRTKVYIGEPYMPFTEKRRANAEDYERVTEDIMEHIRAIRDTRAEREAQG